MGHSAKVHKRVVKKAAASSLTSQPKQKSVVQHVQSAKKRAGLKSKAKARSGRENDHVLGGADYVTLMLGGRRKAAEEALRLPAE